MGGYLQDVPYPVCGFLSCFHRAVGMSVDWETDQRAKAAAAASYNSAVLVSPRPTEVKLRQPRRLRKRLKHQSQLLRVRATARLICPVA